MLNVFAKQNYFKNNLISNFFINHRQNLIVNTSCKICYQSLKYYQFVPFKCSQIYPNEMAIGIVHEIEIVGRNARTKIKSAECIAEHYKKTTNKVKYQLLLDVSHVIIRIIIISVSCVRLQTTREINICKLLLVNYTCELLL